jgi:hypothetical protein
MRKTIPFSHYPANETGARPDEASSFFGLICSLEGSCDELHGYEITMSGDLVLPELRLLPEQEEQKFIQAILC